MEKQDLLNGKASRNVKRATEGTSERSKRESVIYCLRGGAFLILGFLLGGAKMLFDTRPLGFALLGASRSDAPFILIGMTASAFMDGKVDISLIVGAFVMVLSRMLAGIFLEKTALARKERHFAIYDIFGALFSENIHLRVMSGAVGVFLVGVWRIIEGGFRFYDLFASIFYLILTPLGTILFSKCFDVSARRKEQGKGFAITPSEQRLFDLSWTLIACAAVYSVVGTSIFGISVPLAAALFIVFGFCKKGIIYGVISGLMLGASISPEYAPMLAFCALSYASVSKLSLFGGGFASCIAGLVWGIYVNGIGTLGTDLPALLSASMVYCTAERLNAFEDIERFFERERKKEPELTPEMMLAEHRANNQDERLRSISDSFSTLSEIFYNLSSKLKRPSMLDLRSICEESFERHCKECENRSSCFGGEYALTLDMMKKMTVQLHSMGVVDTKKLPDSFKKKCHLHGEIVKTVNRSCSIATKKAFQNEKTEIFALDYDAVASILNDAIAENENEFKLDCRMGKKISRAISELGYGEHSVMVFGKRKLKIIARNLDLGEHLGDMSALKSRLEEVTGIALAEPSFELAFGSVNMQIEAKRAFSAACAFSSSACEGESVCGDTVSIFENKNDYLYALINDGMGTGRSAALASEVSSTFLRNMLSAGNQMETSLRMLNSVLRSKGSRSEDECSSTVDLLQLDLYSGAITLIKSGAAPTFVLRRDNVFKLASPSFPIGILRHIDAKQISMNCEDGDLIVMISDGATRQGDDCSFLNDMLREPAIAGESPQRIADKIIRRAKAESEGPLDDISVVVIKITKEICNW